MKILLAHLVDEPGQMAGAERVVLDLATELARAGHRVDVAVNPGVLADEVEAAGVEVRRYAARTAGPVRMAADLRWLVRRCEPDVIHSHHRLMTWMATLVARGIPVVQTLHVYPRSRVRLTRYGDVTVCVSESLRRRLIETGSDPGRLTTVINGVSADRFRSVRPSPGERLRVVALGRLVEQKGHRHLIEAVARMGAHARSRIEVEIVGDGPLRDELARSIAAHRLGTVRLSSAEPAPRVFERADVVALPSEWEGTPLVLLEAWACRLPVVASAVDGVVEVASDGEALLVPPADPSALARAFEHLLADPTARASLADRGARAFRARHTAGAMAQGYLEVFERVARAGGAA